MKFGFEGGEKQLQASESVEQRETRAKARENFDMHVQNLERFELLFAGQENSPEYALLRNELLRLIYESGKLMDEAEE